MKILITGGAGFIGSNLAHYLKSKHEIFILDNFTAGSLENIKGLDGVACDIRNINDANFKFKPELVIHLAAINSLPYAFKYPRETYEVNVHGTAEVLKYCEENSCGIIFAGTSAEYELTTQFPTPETECCPDSPYAISKAIGGKMIKWFHKKTELPSIHTRFFSTFGPAQDHNRDVPPVISIFLKNLHYGEESTLFLQGKKERDYVYVEDNNRALDLIINNIASFGHEIINIGTGERISIFNLFKVCQKVVNNSKSSYNLSEGDMWPDPTIITQADIVKLKKIGWSQQVSLEQGLTLHYNWLKTELEKNESTN